MSAERLRLAAKALRGRAEAATTGPWSAHIDHDDDPTILSAVSERYVAQTAYDGLSNTTANSASDADYIVTMHPGVGLALADWLDDLADHGASALMPTERGAFVIADLILGGEDR